MRWTIWKITENYRKSSHCTYDIKYHLVWITKYRKPVITGQIAIRTRELVRMICQSNEVEILAGHVGSDHIHLLVSVPPHLSASKLAQYIKGATSRKLQMEYKELNKQFWGQHLWAGGYFVASNGWDNQNVYSEPGRTGEEYLRQLRNRIRSKGKKITIRVLALGCFSSTSNLPALAGSGWVKRKI